MGRLPDDPQFPPVVTEPDTQETVSGAIYRRGRWWEPFRWAHHSQGRDREFNRRKLRRNLAFRAWLSGQPRDPDL